LGDESGSGMSEGFEKCRQVSERVLKEAYLKSLRIVRDNLVQQAHLVEGEETWLSEKSHGRSLGKFTQEK
jgi:hypothetical protein